ncbi:MAG: methyltransferase domain-containing protein [Armatimonadetes bacterium]|nr:methyltransferase domain-containing protein [Armatimonadota bacterium]
MTDASELKWSADEAARIVRETYGAVVPTGSKVAQSLYTADELAVLPEAVVGMALGMGNPVRYADLKPGEVVLDLGSGGGIDTLLAALKVGPPGRAIGLDMTPEMLEKARASAAAAGVKNVEFIEGRMEAIPLPDASVDVIISNGVINLSTEKGKVFAEAFRVLRPAGRLVFSDSVIDGTLPREVLESEAAYAG